MKAAATREAGTKGVAIQPTDAGAELQPELDQGLRTPVTVTVTRPFDVPEAEDLGDLLPRSRMSRSPRAPRQTW